MTTIGIASLNYMINGKPNARLPLSYVHAIKKGGSIPLIIPVVNEASYIKNIIHEIDGLVIPGGSDVNPQLYNEQLLPCSEGIDDELDHFQIKLIQEALKYDLPILGICRGHQILNVALGGSLYQDIAYVKRTEDIIHDQLLNGYLYEQTIHDVIFKDGSILEDLFGKKMKTNSFHHQMIKKLGVGLEIIGHSEDGIIEAIVHPGFKFVLGVQWHPERSEDQLPLFKLFNEVCKK